MASAPNNRGSHTSLPYPAATILLSIVPSPDLRPKHRIGPKHRDANNRTIYKIHMFQQQIFVLIA
jgi:hypothetical protein